MTNDAEKLATLFEKFPGIGPRQAKRFVYFLLKSGNEYRNNIEVSIHNLAQNIHECSKCQRYYANGSSGLCGLCGNTARNNEQLLIVEKDADLDSIEKSGAYSGLYFVLGGRVRLTDSDNKVPNKTKLLALIQSMEQLNEIILAFPTTVEGEHTAQILTQELKSFNNNNEGIIEITMLGRGLSTGTELEYADDATLRSAFEGRN